MKHLYWLIALAVMWIWWGASHYLGIDVDPHGLRYWWDAPAHLTFFSAFAASIIIAFLKSTS